MTKDAINAIHRAGGPEAVARESGLSAATVYRAISGRHCHRKTVQAIVDATARLGEGIHPAEVTNACDGALYHLGIGLTTYRIRVRLHPGVRYRGDVHYQLRHGENAWHAVGRVEASTKAEIVNAAKAAARARVEEDRENARGKR